MQLKYIGSSDAVLVPAADIEVKRGETAEFTDEVAAGLLAQGSSVDAEGNPTPGTEWEAVASPKKAKPEPEGGNKPEE